MAGSGNIQVGQGPPIGLGGPPPGQGEPQPGGRPNLAPSPGMGMAPAGQQNQGQIPPGPNMHHYRGIIPQFVSTSVVEKFFKKLLQLNGIKSKTSINIIL